MKIFKFLLNCIRQKPQVHIPQSVINEAIDYLKLYSLEPLKTHKELTKKEKSIISKNTFNFIKNL